MDNKLQAIKAIREAVKTASKPTVEHTDAGVVIITPGAKLGLRECKELVEAIMRLGVRDYLNDKGNDFERFTGDPFTGIKKDK